MRSLQLVFLALSAVAVFGAVSPVLEKFSSEALGLPPWDRLDVTWAKFTGVPITASDAASKGWTLSGGCSDSAPWSGNRYLLNNDLSTAPIYSSSGILAGFQFGIYQQPPSTWLSKIWEVQTAFSPSGQKYYTVTTYFMDPEYVCSSSMTLANATMREVGTGLKAIGDRLFLKKGNISPVDYMVLPLAEKDATGAGWVQGKCFVSMGRHYWYQITSTMSCDDIFPIFIIYNGGTLTTYGAITGVGNAQNQTSSRWEHPGGSELHYFLPDGGAPDCIFNAGPLSTQHVFLTNPIFDFC